MRELTKAVMEFSWAMSLYGARRFGSLVLPRQDCAAEDAAASFYTVTIAAQDELDDLIRGAFQAGDQIQRGFIDVMFDVVTLEAFDRDNPRNLLQLTLDAARQSEDTLRVWTPGRAGSAAWRELQNKLHVFQLVKDARTTLKITSDTYIPLVETVEEAYKAGPYPALWLVEGLGHDYADTYWNRGVRPRGILTRGEARDLPDESLTMLHAGIGLSFAQRLLHALTPESSQREAQRVLADFIALCRENSHPGYVGAAYESLGLVARTIFPHIVGVVDRGLCEMDEEVLAYFWHGVGRALYFSAVYFIPGFLSPWPAAQREPPHELGRLNAVAGLTWAVVEVNILDPEVMESLLRNQGGLITRTDAFANGVSSGVIMRHDTTPDDTFTTKWCRHQPARDDEEVARLWETQVRGPCRDALGWFYPVLKERALLGEVFRYQSLPDLVEELEAEGRP